MQRRDFLAGGLLALVPAPLALAGGLPAGSAAAQIDQAHFSALIGEHAYVYPAGARGVKLRLLRVVDASQPASPQLRQFTLILAGTPGSLKEGTYEADLPGLQRMLIHLEALPGSASEAQFRVAFNLL